MRHLGPLFLSSPITDRELSDFHKFTPLNTFYCVPGEGRQSFHQVHHELLSRLFRSPSNRGRTSTFCSQSAALLSEEQPPDLTHLSLSFSARGSRWPTITRTSMTPMLSSPGSSLPYPSLARADPLAYLQGGFSDLSP